jgi:cytosine/adenosine deaminase-related metal-dependent hydrolase
VIVRASAVYCQKGRVLTPGTLHVSDGRIWQLYEDAAGKVDLDLKGYAIFPGLINMHCHLEYQHFSGQVMRTGSFSKWLSSVNELKHQSSSAEYAKSIMQACRRLAATGTTSVVNICAHPEAVPETLLPLRIWWAMEGTDVQREFDFPPLRERLAVCPHSPYLASAKLFRRGKKMAEKLGAVFTTHVNESDEELEMFTLGSGPLYELMKDLGRDMSDCGQSDALGQLLDEHLLPERSLLAHLNYVEDSDLSRLKQAGHCVVHCPSCHEFFDREHFHFQRLRAAGVRVTLGTDSAASGSDLDMRQEMRLFCASQQHLQTEEVFDICTRQAAEALGLGGVLGCLLPGFSADFFAVRCEEGQEPLQALFESREDVRLTCTAGRIVHSCGK